MSERKKEDEKSKPGHYRSSTLAECVDPEILKKFMASRPNRLTTEIPWGDAEDDGPWISIMVRPSRADTKKRDED